MAQPAPPIDTTVCKAEEDALEQDIDIARSKGQMLRRRQLAEELAALHARCQAVAPVQSRAARVEKLEQEIRELRTALGRAEEQLRQLKQGGS
ncbi:DUF1090 family protein [Variovorax sp. KK3]|uniref:DUF1090 family protein n=1 Tax=Variovorax sp. KK3 TaxID=1855728 RepID=UPI002118FB41|nr:DUF1090 family protein [Variovorax sp. KK3]